MLQCLNFPPKLTALAVGVIGKYRKIYLQCLNFPPKLTALAVGVIRKEWHYVDMIMNVAELNCYILYNDEIILREICPALVNLCAILNQVTHSAGLVFQSF